MDAAHKTLLLNTFNAYIAALDRKDLEPLENYLPYDFEFAENRIWSLQLCEWLVVDDLQELTNTFNHWRSLLLRWHAWNDIVGTRDDSESWALRNEFYHSLAHDCLLGPSAIRDTFTALATETLHQIRMAEDKSIPDHLASDPSPPKFKTSFMTRERKEMQLVEIAARWPLGAPFTDALKLIDTLEYRRETYNYRNMHSHTIGPRLGIGHTRAVKRLAHQAEELLPIGNDRYEMTKIPGKVQISYGFGGTPPLDLETARRLNLQQFYAARDCYAKYLLLVEDSVKALPKVVR